MPSLLTALGEACLCCRTGIFAPAITSTLVIQPVKSGRKAVGSVAPARDRLRRFRSAPWDRQGTEKVLERKGRTRVAGRRSFRFRRSRIAYSACILGAAAVALPVAASGSGKAPANGGLVQPRILFPLGRHPVCAGPTQLLAQPRSLAARRSVSSGRVPKASWQYSGGDDLSTNPRSDAAVRRGEQRPIVATPWNISDLPPGWIRLRLKMGPHSRTGPPAASSSMNRE